MLIKSPLIIPYSFILFVLQISYVAIIFDYITKLKKLQCECSESWKREYGYIGSIVYFCYFGLILLLLRILLRTSFVFAVLIISFF